MNYLERIEAATCVQRVFRGYLARRCRLPNAILAVQRLLRSISYKGANRDGRLSSAIFEDSVLRVLQAGFGERLEVSEARMWHDCLVRDYRHGWLPVNIKVTTTRSADNVGNLAICLWALTDYPLPLRRRLNSGEASRLLLSHLSSKRYNRNLKRDYYFVVLNKGIPGEVIVNSLKGLRSLTPNANNPPFQIRWRDNSEFRYFPVEEVVARFVECVGGTPRSWREEFMEGARALAAAGLP